MIESRGIQGVLAVPSRKSTYSLTQNRPIKEEDEDDDDYEDGYDYNNEQDSDYRPHSSTSSVSGYRWY